MSTSVVLPKVSTRPSLFEGSDSDSTLLLHNPKGLVSTNFNGRHKVQREVELLYVTVLRVQWTSFNIIELKRSPMI